VRGLFPLKNEPATSRGMWGSVTPASENIAFIQLDVADEVRATQAVFLSGLFVFAALPSCFLWLAFGATIQRILYNQRRLRLFNVAMGALLALSTVLILR